MKITESNVESNLESWRLRIDKAWSKSVESVIEVGRLIRQAKQELGVSYSLLETKLPFSSSVAAYLVKIADNPVLSNPVYFNKLPNSYNTLYHLAGVEEQELVDKLEKGEITPNFTLLSAKAIKAPSKNIVATKATKKQTKESFVVGTISIELPRNVEEFTADLQEFLAKYRGSVAYSFTENSLALEHRKALLKHALARIKVTEAELNTVTYDQLRMLESAAYYLQKEKNQKVMGEIVHNGEVVLRPCLPTDYKDYESLRKLLQKDVITRVGLRKWCVENKVPSQFVELRNIDKELYVWEQVRLVIERADVKGGLKRLRDMATFGKTASIKKLAAKVLKELNRFNNRVE